MSEVKVNKLSPRSGTTVTIGDSGDTINIVGTLQNNGSAIPGDISSVVAGTGLSGGGTSGDVTLNIEAAQPTITSLGTLTSATISGDLTVDTNTLIIDSSLNNVTFNVNGFTVNGSSFDINTIIYPDGIAMADSRAISFGTDADFELLHSLSGDDILKLNLKASDNHFAIYNSATELVRFTGSGNVGIGTTGNPDAQLHIKGSDTTNQVIIENTDGGVSSAPDLVLFRNSASPVDGDVLGRIDFRGDNDAGQEVNYIFMSATATDVSDGSEDVKLEFEGMKAGNNAKLFTISEAEVIVNDDSGDVDFRVESNGISNMFFVDANSDKIFINTSSSISGSSAYLHLKNNYTRTGISLESNNTAPHHSITFHNPNGQVGSINTDGSSTVYNTSSDYRLKENVNYDFDATTRLKQLKPARFNFIADADKTVDGFLAHEVSSVVPEAISGEKDEVETYTDDDGNEQTKPKYQGIDQSKLVPLLVKTIQELEARITTLEG